MKQQGFFGIDVGSVSTNLVVIDEENKIVQKLYLRTDGRPIDALKSGMKRLKNLLGHEMEIIAAGTTGSGRQLASFVAGADIVKNEITAHAVAASHMVPDIQTIIEIGGQDSKIILMRDGVVSDFAMNTVCAAGTGSFLDRQASRLRIPIEEFGSYAIKSKCPVRIAGRCAVFAESDMINKQQTGHTSEDIIAGLCAALVRNYMNNLAKGKEIREPIIFQGGVAANIGIVTAFEQALDKKIIIPQHYDVMGAYGVALLAKEQIESTNQVTRFIGFDRLNDDFNASSFECKDCPNICEVIKIMSGETIVAHLGDKCGKYTGSTNEKTDLSDGMSVATSLQEQDTV